MNERKLVSICIPSYNHVQFLGAAIESALAQTYRPIEIIVVDDGSTDGSLDLALRYARKFRDVVRVYSHEDRKNHGISATVNRAIDLAKGEYWSPLASDDVLLPGKTAAHVAFLESDHQLGWMCGHASVIDADGNDISGRLSSGGVNGGDPFIQLIQGNFIVADSLLVRRDCLEAAGRFDESCVYSDWDFALRMLSHAPYGCLDRDVLQYRIHGRNTSVGIPVAQNLKYIIQAQYAMKRNFHTWGRLQKTPRNLAVLDLELAFNLLCAKREVASMAQLESAFATDAALPLDTEFLEEWFVRHVASIHVLGRGLRALLELLVFISERFSTFSGSPAAKVRELLFLRALDHVEDLQIRNMALEAEKQYRDQEIQQYRESRSFRLGRVLLTPLSHARSFLLGDRSE